MYSRTDLFSIAKAFGSPLTGQTLRNYTKAGLCSGVYGSESGLARQGTIAQYSYETIIEATVSRMMLIKSGRKLVTSAVAFGRYIFQFVLSDPTFIFDSSHVLSQLEIFLPGSVIHTVENYGPKGSTINVRVSQNEVYSLQKIMDVAREWCVKYAILLTYPISIDHVVDCNKTHKIISVDWDLLVQVNADNMYFLHNAPPVGDKVVIDPHSNKIKRIIADVVY